jgi:hypothetical protein
VHKNGLGNSFGYFKKSSGHPVAELQRVLPFCRMRKRLGNKISGQKLTAKNVYGAISSFARRFSGAAIFVRKDVVLTVFQKYQFW